MSWSSFNLDDHDDDGDNDDAKYDVVVADDGHHTEDEVQPALQLLHSPLPLLQLQLLLSTSRSLLNITIRQSRQYDGTFGPAWSTDTNQEQIVGEDLHKNEVAQEKTENDFDGTPDREDLAAL